MRALARLPCGKQEKFSALKKEMACRNDLSRMVRNARKPRRSRGQSQDAPGRNENKSKAADQKNKEAERKRSRKTTVKQHSVHCPSKTVLKESRLLPSRKSVRGDGRHDQKTRSTSSSHSRTTLQKERVKTCFSFSTLRVVFLSMYWRGETTNRANA